MKNGGTVPAFMKLILKKVKTKYTNNNMIYLKIVGTVGRSIGKGKQ